MTSYFRNIFGVVSKPEFKTSNDENPILTTFKKGMNKKKQIAILTWNLNINGKVFTYPAFLTSQNPLECIDSPDHTLQLTANIPAYVLDHYIANCHEVSSSITCERRTRQGMINKVFLNTSTIYPSREHEDRIHCVVADIPLIMDSADKLVNVQYLTADDQIGRKISGIYFVIPYDYYDQWLDSMNMCEQQLNGLFQT